MFSNPLGQPFDQRTYADSFERIVKAAGVEKTIQLGTNDASVGFHTLRHTFATRAVENGMYILVLAKILGHAQASTTQNIYAHVLEEANNRIADTLGDVLFTSKIKKKEPDKKDNTDIAG